MPDRDVPPARRALRKKLRQRIRESDRAVFDQQHHDRSRELLAE
jgi:hypothetical protein